MNELVQAYNEYIRDFSLLSVDEKKKMTISELKTIIETLKEISESLKLDTKLVLSKEMNDLNGITITEDDFLEGIFAYINTLQILIDECLEKILQMNDSIPITESE